MAHSQVRIPAPLTTSHTTGTAIPHQRTQLTQPRVRRPTQPHKSSVQGKTTQEI